MSAHKTILDVPLTIAAANSSGVHWVRRHGGLLGGRALGTVQRVQSAWNWAPTRLAFIGDGRTGCERDGDRTTPVPPALLADGRERTQEKALAALVMWLREHEAPVLGYGPHSAVEDHVVPSVVGR